ncbi:MAG TPA: YaiI/YqxD family protein [Gemmatimonadales bacterium]|nr:YaiI/YqxD family protein [Gemmatimonadales bacterium]
MLWDGGRGGAGARLSRGASLRIWIDADAAPRNVKELLFRSARRLGVEVVLVANQKLQTPPGNPLVTAVWVDGGPDVADGYIVTHAVPGDLVVTQDVPLAALLVPRGIAVLDPRGEEHTPETIGERLSVRNFMEQARLAGATTGGPPPYDGRARQAFAGALDRALTRLRRKV